MSFDPDEALDKVMGMQRAREAYGSKWAPEPDFAAAILRNARATNLKANFVHVLNDEGDMVWILEVDTGRGVLEFKPDRAQTWREYLGSDPTAVAFGLLPPDAPRETKGAWDVD